MTLGAVLEAATRRRKTLVYHAPEPGDVADQFEARNVDVEFQPIPADGPAPFVTVHEDGAFVAAVALDDLQWFLAPPRPAARDPGDLSPAYRALYELFDDTVFAALSRRQLLAAAREVEDRAWRTGSGEFHVGFQSVVAFDAQRLVYRQLATETDLDVHVYVAPEADASDLDDLPLAVHRSPHPDVGRYWFLVYDGDDTDRQSALVAEQTDTDEYDGVWTYDPELVSVAVEALPE